MPESLVQYNFGHSSQIPLEKVWSVSDFRVTVIESFKRKKELDYFGIGSSFYKKIEYITRPENIFPTFIMPLTSMTYTVRAR